MDSQAPQLRTLCIQYFMSIGIFRISCPEVLGCGTQLDLLLARRHHSLLPLLAGDVTGACRALGSKAPGLRKHSTFRIAHTSQNPPGR